MVVTCILLQGCATPASGISARSVDAGRYAGDDCGRLRAEESRLRAELADLSASLDRVAQKDRVVTGLGLLLFWPALFTVGGNELNESSYARMQGEYNAVRTAMRRANC